MGLASVKAMTAGPADLPDDLSRHTGGRFRFRMNGCAGRTVFQLSLRIHAEDGNIGENIERLERLALTPWPPRRGMGGGGTDVPAGK